MKNFLCFFIVLVLLVSCVEITKEERVRREANQQSTEVQAKAQSAIGVPNIAYFQERRTIAKWASHWDKPSAACYVYLISYGNIIGYYVSDGKPASTGSFLTPEYRREPGWDSVMQLPDIDGTYGTNNAGIRFFTASGIAVEWAGSGTAYIYSDVPLKLSVPLLGD
jgi:hypothetical protein